MTNRTPGRLGRRDFLIGAASAAVAVPTSMAQATYPARPVMINHPSPGGGLDAVTRLIAQKLQAAWGQPVLVEARPGAAGAVAASLVARSPGDGYTLLVTGSGVLTSLLNPADPGYRLEDLAPVSLVSIIPVGLGVRSSLGVRTMAEFIALARSRPGQLTYGSHGQGSNGHVVGTLLSGLAGVQMIHVPYKGEATALTDLVAGNIDAALLSIGGVSRFPGKIVPLAVAGSKRFPTFPDVPTLVESGWGEAAITGWAAMFAPARTPRSVIDKVASQVAGALAEPDVSNRMLELGFMPSAEGPARLQAFVQSQMQTLRTLSDAGRITFG